MLPSATRYASVLAVFRIFVGMFWFLHGYGKLTSGQWGGPNGMFVGIAQDMAKNTSGAYHDFVAGFVVPHAPLFALLVCWGETLTGVALILGLFTRLGGAGGVFLALNYWLSKESWAHLDGFSSLDVAAMGLSAVHLALPTGLVFGVDGWLAARKRPAALVEKSSGSVTAAP